MASILRSDSNQDIRQLLKRKRAKLSKTRRHIANIKANTLAFQALKQHRLVASYLSFGSELSTKKLNQQLIKNKQPVFVPVTLANQQMAFLPWRPFCILYKNKYHIEQPRDTLSRRISPARLDAIVTPLLGFDKKCCRIGMGGGFYDRFLSKRSVNSYRLGIGYSLQELRRIEPAPWDQALNAVVTERRRIFKRSQKH